MNGGYKIDDQHGMYYFTFQVVYWIDVFSRRNYKDVVIDSFKFCRTKFGLNIHAYVIMSNHIHCILSSEKIDLSTLIKRFKTHTSKTILKTIKEEPESRREWMLKLFEHAAKKHKRNKEYQFWTHENQPKEIYSHSFMMQKLDYIHENPVRAGIVDNAEDYLYSSARNYVGMLSVMPVDLLY